MKRCSTSYVVKEVQIKTMRYHYTPIRMAKSLNTRRWCGCGETGTLIHCWWEHKMVQLPWKTVWQFIAKLNILLPYYPAIILLSTNPKELKIHIHTKSCTWMFLADLLLIVKTWKQPRCPSAGDWTNCSKSRNGISLRTKRKCYHTMKRCGGNLNAHY